MSNSKMINTLVSIVTPSYNQGHFIEDTIKSVMNQDYPNIEHIVVDGVSTDNTIDILKKYENKYNLKWVSEADDGQTDALNKGFGMAQGEIVSWLNSDDVLFNKSAISDVVNSFNEHADISIIYGDGVFINENNLILSVYRAVPWFSFDRFRRVQFFFQPSSFFRKELTESYKLDVKINLPMDQEYYLRLADKGFKFRYIPKILSGYRVHDTTKTKSLAEQALSERREVQKKYGEDFDSKYYILRISDKTLSALLIISGVKTIIKIHSNTEKNRLAFPGKFNSIPKSVLTQLYSGISIL